MYELSNGENIFDLGGSSKVKGQSQTPKTFEQKRYERKCQ